MTEYRNFTLGNATFWTAIVGDYRLTIAYRPSEFEGYLAALARVDAENPGSADKFSSLEHAQRYLERKAELLTRWVTDDGAWVGSSVKERAL